MALVTRRVRTGRCRCQSLQLLAPRRSRAARPPQHDQPPPGPSPPLYHKQSVKWTHRSQTTAGVAFVLAGTDLFPHLLHALLNCKHLQRRRTRNARRPLPKRLCYHLQPVRIDPNIVSNGGLLVLRASSPHITNVSTMSRTCSGEASRQIQMSAPTLIQFWVSAGVAGVQDAYFVLVAIELGMCGHQGVTDRLCALHCLLQSDTTIFPRISTSQTTADCDCDELT